jgi:anhydro-N-acetylmuramic acid kinase
MSRPIATRVLGLMSGTSADGIDATLVEISGSPPRISASFEGFHSHPYPQQVRDAILRISNGGATTSAEISQLSFAIGEQFARAALAACKALEIPSRKIDLIASHGQTLYHQGKPSKFLDAGAVSSTLQVGEPAVIAERTGITTIADFRPADMAAGGQGAPLVPFVDYHLFRDEQRGRAALNIGGIANVTAIPAGARAEDVWAFDTGPGNMIIDALVHHFSNGRLNYDRNSQIGLSGKTIHALLAKSMADPYFRVVPPKTAGREQFGGEYVAKWITWARKRRFRSEDLVRTATILTALSIANAFRKFILPDTEIHDLIVSGGGAENPLLMAELSALLPGIEIFPSSHFGIPGNAKEAFAFAILAYEAFHARANNLPSATGARHPAILGKTVHAPPR